ncbi:hypothetical protein D3C85_927040 [compost metagenome]
MAAQQVVHGGPFKHVTTRRVDVQVDLRHIAHGGQIAGELFGRNAPRANFVIQHHLDHPALQRGAQ